MNSNGKQRDALNDIIDTINKWRTEGTLEHWQYSQLFDIADAALAEPLRNCEVGTVEQQIKRFYDDYYAENSKCKRRWSFGGSALDWAQMPYESGMTNESR